MVDFGTLYNYNSSTGVVIPQTTTVKSTLESAFKTIFGEGLSVSEETPIGRLIEALTFLFVNVLGVNAQNANGFNPSQAIGNYLDALGNMFGVTRLSGESDYSYRIRILESQSRGSGYAQSIRNAISESEVEDEDDDISAICVLDNGLADNAVLPDQTIGISVPPHSVFVCVSGGTEANIADAIYKSISAGCGFTTSTEYGTPIQATITDETSGSVKTVYFYRPSDKEISISVSVNSQLYSGSDITTDTKTAITDYIASNNIATTLTTAQIISAIAACGKNIVCTSASITHGASSGLTSIIAKPNEKLVCPSANITVTVS